MKWNDYIFIAIIFFAMGFVVGWHPTFESVRNFIVGGLSLGLMIEVVGSLKEWFRERRDERAKECKKFKGYIHEHNKKLIDTYIKPCYENRTAGIITEHFGIDHLKTGYSDIWRLQMEWSDLVDNVWTEGDAIRDYLKNEIEEGLPPNIKQDLSFVNDGVVIAYFTLDDIVDSIYNTVEKFSKNDGVPDNYKLDKSFGIPSIVDNERTDLKTFIETTIKDMKLNDKFKLLDNGRKLSEKKHGEFYQRLKQICHDFEDRHKELDGTCKDCEEWHEKLKSLK